MSDKTRRAVALIAAIVGLVLLAAAFFVQPELAGWTSNVAVEIGATLFLFVPLLYLTKRLEGKIQKVEQKTTEEIGALAEQVAEAREEIRLTREQLSEKVVEELNTKRVPDIALFEALEGAPSQADVAKAVARATELNLITKLGCRVEIFETDLYLLFRPQYNVFNDVPNVELVIETQGGLEKDSILWRSSEEVDSVETLVKIGEALQRIHKFPGDAAFDPGKIFADLKETLLMAYRCATGRDGVRIDIGPVYQFCAPQWVITEEAIKKLSPFDTYPIHLERLDEQDWFFHVKDRQGVDAKSLWEALKSARALWKSKRLVPSTRAYADPLEGI